MIANTDSITAIHSRGRNSSTAARVKEAASPSHSVELLNLGLLVTRLSQGSVSRHDAQPPASLAGGCNSTRKRSPSLSLADAVGSGHRQLSRSARTAPTQQPSCSATKRSAQT